MTKQIVLAPKKTTPLWVKYNDAVHLDSQALQVFFCCCCCCNFRFIESQSDENLWFVCVHIVQCYNACNRVCIVDARICMLYLSMYKCYTQKNIQSSLKMCVRSFLLSLSVGWVCAKSWHSSSWSASNKLNLKYLVKVCCEWIHWIYVSALYLYLYKCVWFDLGTNILDMRRQALNCKSRKNQTIKLWLCQVKEITGKFSKIFSTYSHTVRMVPFRLMQLIPVIDFKKSPVNVKWAEKFKSRSYILLLLQAVVNFHRIFPFCFGCSIKI